MRIAYYHKGLDAADGSAIHGRALVNAWREAGHMVLCLPREPIGELVFLAAQREQVSSFARPLPPTVRFVGNLVRCVVQGPATLRKLTAWSPDLLVLRRLPYDFVADDIVRRAPVPVALEMNGLHHLESLRLRGVRTPKWESRREISTYRRASLVVAVSESLGHQAIAIGVEPSRVAVVPNGVDTRVFRPDVTPDSGLIRWARQHSHVIGFSGMPAPTHNMRGLLRALVALVEASPRVGFLFVGPTAPQLESVFHGMASVTARVRCTGPVTHERVPEMLACCDLLWAWFTNDDASPLKEYEYLAMAKPVLIAGHGQAAAIVRQSGAGIALESPTSDAFARAAQKLLAMTPSERARLGARGRRWVQANGTWAASADAVLAKAEQLGLVSTTQGAFGNNVCEGRAQVSN